MEQESLSILSNLKDSSEKKVLTFPSGFLWGVAISSHQTEGGNANNDWYAWEKAGKTRHLSERACEYWERFSGDHALASEMGCNAFRMSLEWSRIEPREGEFSQGALEHYREILRDIKKKGMKRVVTLWHWTLPLWLSQKGGWARSETANLFLRYSEKVVEELGEEIDIYILMNEPRLPLNRGYLVGDFPPGKRNIWQFLKARKNMVLAARLSYESAKKRRPELPIGMTQFCNDFDYYGFKPATYLTEKIESFYNWHFFKELKGYYDFVGINYYFSLEVRIFPPSIKMQTQGKIKTEMGWGVFPEGLYEIVSEAYERFRKPIYIFENGIANAKDDHRTSFIKEHLASLHKAIADGADVRGYFHWSLLDNFEWNDGYDRKFGLFEVDFDTQVRTIRKSAYEYAKICRSNELEI